jgi:SAM-dependent methyltransferase
MDFLEVQFAGSLCQIAQSIGPRERNKNKCNRNLLLCTLQRSLSRSRCKLILSHMAKSSPFEKHPRRYERWFMQHQSAYHSELLVIRALLPWEGLGLEIGVGSGRFAAPLGTRIGIDPSSSMLRYASRRGINSVQAVAECLPFPGGTFDYALVVTTICFVDDPARMLSEAWRVLRPRGSLCIGFIDRETPLGQVYLAQQPRNPFYRVAKFYSAREVQHFLKKAGFSDLVWIQTLFAPLRGTTEIASFRVGCGDGAFVVVRAHKLG